MYTSSDVSNDTMEDSTVRLAKGIGNNTGFVELILLGQWVPICGYSWDILDASVVCRELGYPTAVSATRKRRYNSPSYGVYITYSCTGDEAALKQCSTSYQHLQNFYFYYYYCYNSAFVNCSGEFIQICNAL